MTGAATMWLAAASACLMLSQPDQRAYCLAKENQRPTDCAAIVNSDLRIRCRVELGQDKSQCMSIADRTERALCQAASSSIRR
ncbi:MAG: hypothetical protein EBU46_11135 [Nitrosomonadaceae bacterium]|nr:hypothetical protein [Nitrosomonadaceae bacterium]